MVRVEGEGYVFWVSDTADLVYYWQLMPVASPTIASQYVVDQLAARCNP